MNESIIKIIKENGDVVNYKILFTFKCEEINKDYIAFTDESIDQDGNMNIYIAYYNPDKELNELIPVTDENELNMAMEVFEQVREQYTEE